ncbi:LysR family transcriptional regulator [Pseudomonas sp. MWU13-2860]|nr:LysR family transcriptional regulator [Pseudomonas sp. MWU13-2860]
MTDDLDTTLLRALIAVARHGSINRAAAALGRTQPALSLQLRKLEQHCGQVLLQRSPRGVSLNAAGRQLLPYAERIIGLTEQMRPTTAPTAARRCRVGLIEDVISRHLPQVLADFAATQPQWQLEVRVALERELSPAFRQGELDLLIVNPRQCGLEQTPSWVLEYPLQWLARDGVKPEAEIMPLVMFAAPCSWRDAMLRALHQVDQPYRIVFESSSQLAVQAALEAGLGVGALFPDAISERLLPLPEHCLPPLPAVPLALYRQRGDDGLELLCRLVFRALGQFVV